jgi:hypothetical protein
LPRQSEQATYLNEFVEFVNKAKQLLSERKDHLPTAAFRQFGELAHAAVVAPLATRIESLRTGLAALEGWLIPPTLDLLEIGGLTWDENAYTELIRWAFCPMANPEAALSCQQAWIRRLRLKGCTAATAATARSQVVTSNGIPDLVLEFSDIVLVVEAKTGTSEHESPDGQMQTHAYAEAVRAVLELNQSKRILVIFLTPGRRLPSNPKAMSTSYFELALALAEGLQGIALGTHLQTAYAMLITHLATCAQPKQIPLQGLLANCRKESNLLLKSNFNGTIELAKLLNPE